MQKILAFLHKLKDLPRATKVAILYLIAAIVFLYYPIGAFIVHKISDNQDFTAGNFEIENGSRAVAVAAALVNREIDKNHWTPNDPIFSPGSMLERMPNFQKGIVAACARFTVELSDQIGRARGSSQVDPDLERAAGLLKYSPYVWIFDFSTSVIPTASSEKQYRSAVAALKSYNERLSQGDAVFDRRADNLLETLNRIAADIGSSSGALENHIREHSGDFIDTDADKLFYDIKGRMYAYHLIMQGLRADFANIIAERELQSAWDQMLTSFSEGAAIGHFFIINGSLDSQFVPNHLATQGFYLMRARTQLREITSILAN